MADRREWNPFPWIDGKIVEAEGPVIDLDEVAQVILLLLAECETHDHDMDYQTDDRVAGRALEIVRKLKGGS